MVNIGIPTYEKQKKTTINYENKWEKIMNIEASGFNIWRSGHQAFKTFPGMSVEVDQAVAPPASRQGWRKKTWCQYGMHFFRYRYIDCTNIRCICTCIIIYSIQYLDMFICIYLYMISRVYIRMYMYIYNIHTDIFQ